jgi:hypothetical protein
MVAGALSIVAIVVVAVVALTVRGDDGDSRSFRLLYTFDECRGSGCTRAVADHSAGRNPGTVVAGAGGVMPAGALTVVRRERGAAVRLSGALIRVDGTARDAAFNPGTRSFTYGATVRTDGPINGGANILQRGRYGDTTDLWKLQLDPGRQGCSIKGGKGRVTAFAPGDLPADGRWHEVACVITPSHVTYIVDGRSHRSPNTAGAVTLAASELIHVGGVFNDDGTINDQFSKPVDDVFFGIVRD